MSHSFGNHASSEITYDIDARGYTVLPTSRPNALFLSTRAPPVTNSFSRQPDLLFDEQAVRGVLGGELERAHLRPGGVRRRRARRQVVALTLRLVQLVLEPLRANRRARRDVGRCLPRSRVPRSTVYFVAVRAIQELSAFLTVRAPREADARAFATQLLAVVVAVVLIDTKYCATLEP